MSPCTLLLLVDSLYFHLSLVAISDSIVRPEGLFSAGRSRGTKRKQLVETDFKEPDRWGTDTLEKQCVGPLLHKSGFLTSSKGFSD